MGKLRERDGADLDVDSTMTNGKMTIRLFALLGVVAAGLCGQVVTINGSSDLVQNAPGVLNSNFAWLNSHVNGVSYPASPSVHTVPVVTSTGVVVYLAVPNCTLLGYNTGTAAFSCATTATPSAHASTHGSAGSDAVSVDAAQMVSGVLGLGRIPALAASGGGHSAGYAPDPGSSAGTTRFLREDATWVAITGANASQLQGRALASTAPSDLQAVAWSAGSNQWQPTTIDTSIVGEAGNLYFTNARARAAVSGTGQVSYNSSTGAISLTITAANVANNLSDLANAATARTNLGVGHTISIPIAGSPIVTGTGSVGIPGLANFACTINKAQIVGNAPGSITVDVWKAAGAVPSSGGKISASAPVTLSSAQLNQNSSLTGWTATVTAGDVFWATVASVDGVLSSVHVTLTCQ